MTNSTDKNMERSTFLRSAFYLSLGIIMGTSLSSCGSTKTVKPRNRARFYKPRSDRRKKRVKKVRMKG